MRTVILSAIIILLVIGCKKTNSPGPPPPAGGTITITSISPAIPYADDSITITGTGFNPDKTKDTVDFGRGVAAAGGFEPHTNGVNTGSKAIILSATATQLVIKAVNPGASLPNDTSQNKGLNYILFARGVLNDNNGVNEIRVRSGGIQVSKRTAFKELPWFQFTDDNYFSTDLAPNDSFSIDMHGVNSTVQCAAKLSLSCSKGSCSFIDSYLNWNGNTPQCNCDLFNIQVYGCAIGKFITHSDYMDVVHGFVPSNFFNTSYQTVAPFKYSARVTIKMEMENADGRTYRRTVYCRAYPRHP